jgi:uncharacterized protein (UPF0548 family)
MHRAAGVDLRASAERAASGVLVVSRAGLGPVRLTASCAVGWAIDDERRAGFLYGTLPGPAAVAFSNTRTPAGSA